jgi:hypothetical protein
VPIRAPAGSASMLSAPISLSRVCRRGSTAAIPSRSGRTVSTSFIE